jgi:RNA polymerase sigma-70 factor (ECF subfamily)
MTLAQAGSREAFGVLALRHTRRLVGFCAKQLGDVRAAEEVAQETWIYLWSTRASYVPRDRFVVLLLLAARHRCANHRRGTRRREGPLERLSDAGEQAVIPEGAAASQLDELLAEERRRRVRAALDQVPQKQRDALLLRFSEELSYEEMREVMQIGESTLRSRVLYGLRALRDALEGSKS